MVGYPQETRKPALATAMFSAVSFMLGAITSVVSGFLGMKMATYANVRTTLKARKGVRKTLRRVQEGSQVRIRIGSSITGYGEESRNHVARQRIAIRMKSK